MENEIMKKTKPRPNEEFFASQECAGMIELENEKSNLTK